MGEARRETPVNGKKKSLFCHIVSYGKPKQDQQFHWTLNDHDIDEVPGIFQDNHKLLIQASTVYHKYALLSLVMS